MYIFSSLYKKQLIVAIIYTPSISMNKYIENGYFIKRKFIETDLIQNTLNELESLKNSKEVDIYHDQKGLVRRLERIYDKGKALKKIDKKAKNLLKEIFGFDFTIFKDKTKNFF